MTDAALPASPATPSRRAGQPRAPRAAAPVQAQGCSRSGLVVITVFILLAALAPWSCPTIPSQTSWSLVRKPPTAAHWFGTDELGRDILSRVIYGARASLLAGLISVAIALGIGVPLGLARRLSRRLRRRADQPDHRCDAGLPVPDPGDCAGGVPRSEPRQRHDRDRHLGNADLHPPDARRRS